MARKLQLIVYALIDPCTLMIRYIGKSVNGMSRARWHFSASGREGNTHRANWLKGLARDLLVPIVTVLDTSALSRHGLDQLEIWWIAYGKAFGWPLTNMTDGGDGGYKAAFHWTSTPEGAIKIKEVTNRPEFRKRSSETKLGDLNPMKRPEARAKLRATLREKSLVRVDEHGTRFAYDRRGCRCDACKAINTARSKAYRTKHLDRLRAYDKARNARP